MQKIGLNIVPNGICPRVYVNQYDVGREIQIKFKDGSTDYGFASGTTFKVNGRKEDNHVFEYTESDKWDSTHYIINKSMPPGSATTVYLYTTEQMTAAPGEVLMQLTYKLNDAVMGTLNFIMVVQERPEASGDPSESDVPGVVRLINGIAPDADGEVVLKWKDQSSVSNLSVTENTRTMSTTRNAGTYVYVKADDQLYEITSTISSGGTLTPGTNATATSVGAALATLNSQLTNDHAQLVKLASFSLGFLDNTSIVTQCINFADTYYSKVSGNMTFEGIFACGGNSAPSDIPANEAKWKYATGKFIIRYRNSLNGKVDATIILYAYNTNNIAMKAIGDSVAVGSWLILGS